MPSEHHQLGADGPGLTPGQRMCPSASRRGSSFWRDLRFKEVHWKCRAVNFIRRGSAVRAGWAPHLREPKCCPLTQLLGSTLQVSYLPLRLHSSPAPILCYKALLELFICIFFPIIFPYFIVTFGGPISGYQHLCHSYYQKLNYKNLVTKTNTKPTKTNQQAELQQVCYVILKSGVVLYPGKGNLISSSCSACRTWFAVGAHPLGWDTRPQFAHSSDRSLNTGRVKILLCTCEDNIQ